MKRKKLRRIIIPLIIILILAACVIWYISYNANSGPSYNEYQVKFGSINRKIVSSGNAIKNDYDKVLAKYSSKVKEIYAYEGEEVDIGTKLLLLENGKLIVSESKGLVGTIYVSQKDSVEPTSRVLDIIKAGSYFGEFKVNEFNIPYYSIGQSCLLTVLSSNSSYNGKIVSISIEGTSDGGQVFYKVKAKIVDEVNEMILPGMQMYISLDVDKMENCLYVDAEAISFDEENNPYLIIRENDNYVNIKINVYYYNGEVAAIIAPEISDGMIVYSKENELYKKNESAILSTI